MASQRYMQGIVGPFDRAGSASEPVLFQVLSPDNETVLLPEALFLNVNPTNFSPAYSKIITRTQTRGGFLEQHWGDQLTDLSAEASSGLMLNLDTGLAALRRRDTLANYRLHLLEDLFHNNANIYDSAGNIVYKGLIRMLFRGGVYDGYFTSLTISEDASNPFSIQASWSFKIISEAKNFVL